MTDDSTVRPGVVSQHVDLRHGQAPFPQDPQGPGAGRPRRHDGVARRLRLGDRPHLRVVRGALEPRGNPPAPLLAPRGAMPAVRGQPDGRAFARRAQGSRPRLSGAWRVAPSPAATVRCVARRRASGGVDDAAACPLVATVGPLDLPLDVGPHEWLGVLVGPGGDVCIGSSRVNATVQSTAMVLSLAKKPASCWSRTGDMPSTATVMVVGGVQRPAGEDPHHGEEARHDRLHDQVAAAADGRERLPARQLGEHRRPEDEAREQDDDLDHHPGDSASGRPG